MSIILMEKRNKKAQLKIQQMVFMLLAVTIFFVLAGLFFISIRVTNLEKAAIELNRDKASALVQKISSNPEFVFESVPNSVDADKLMILKSDNKYRDFFGVDGIIVQKIYPIEEDKECTIDNYPDCNLIKVFTRKDSAPTQSFVSWCTKKSQNEVSYDDCSLAILMIDDKKLNEEN